MALSTIPTRALSEQGINFRNLIINGDMSIAQRGTSSTSQTSAGYKTCDRFRISINTLGTWTITQDSDTPSNQGFGYSLKLQCTTADASPASTDDLYIQHKIEGQNLIQLKYGGSGAESLTLSFWVKSNKTGTASLNFLQRDNSAKLYSTTYSISSANTWEKKTITIAGDTAGVINNDNGSGFEILWWLNSGSLYTSGTTRNAWSSYADGDSNVSNFGLGGSTSDYINITGVQLEAGTSASDFEFLPHDINLQRCQRYYQQLNQNGANGFCSFSGWRNGTADVHGIGIPLPTPLRIGNPTITKSSASLMQAWDGDGYHITPSAGSGNMWIGSNTGNSTPYLNINTNGFSGLDTGGSISWSIVIGTPSAEFDAEL